MIGWGPWYDKISVGPGTTVMWGNQSDPRIDTAVAPCLRNSSQSDKGFSFPFLCVCVCGVGCELLRKVNSHLTFTAHSCGPTQPLHCTTTSGHLRVGQTPGPLTSVLSQMPPESCHCLETEVLFVASLTLSFPLKLSLSDRAVSLKMLEAFLEFYCLLLSGSSQQNGRKDSFMILSWGIKSFWAGSADCFVRRLVFWCGVSVNGTTEVVGGDLECVSSAPMHTGWITQNCSTLLHSKESINNF